MYGLETGERAVQGCFMCPGNYLLGFKAWSQPGIGGYAMPGSTPLQVEIQGQPRTVLLPMPFTSLAVPFAHPIVDEFGFGYTFPLDWTWHFMRLLRLMPQLKPGDPWTSTSQIGFANGARVPKAVTDAGVPAHPWNWVIYGRDKLAELSSTANASPERLAAFATSELGLATIIHRSRQAAGSLPSDLELYRIWQGVEQGPRAISNYHRRVLALAA